MGKSKKRIIYKNRKNSSLTLKRGEIIDKIIFAVRNDALDENTIKYISLFGITVEEFAEAGLTYEELSAVKHYII